MGSLRRKIILGYLAVGLFVVALSLTAAFELERLEQGLAAEETLFELVDAVMEARRFEKNFILYGDPRDLEQNGAFIALADDVLSRHSEILPLIGQPLLTSGLEGLIADYRLRMAAFVKSKRQGDETALRKAGKAMTDAAHQLAAWRREELHRATRTHRFLLLGVIGGGLILTLVAGTLVSLGVTRPLRRMQERMETLAAGGRPERIDLPSNDSEIRSLAEALNQLLAELELRGQQMMVSQKLASLGVMLSGVAHELNNPLSNISTSCQILLEEGRNADPDFLQEHLAQIDEQCERAKRIVASLLDFSRNQKFLLDDVALKPLAQETLALLRGNLASGAMVLLDIPDDLVLRADRQRLQQVLINLLKNAAEAVGPQGRIELSATSSEGLALVRLRDNGSGIAPSDIAKIFDPFFTTKEVGQGSGLGLFIVHDIVKKHGGSIQALSLPEGGTEFLIRLPLGAKTVSPREGTKE